MEAAVQIFTVGESAYVSTFGFAEVLVICLFILGLGLFFSGMVLDETGGTLLGVVLIVAAVAVLMGTIESNEADERAELEKRQVAAIEQQLHYQQVRLEGNRYTAIDENGQKTYGCFTAISGTQFVMVPGGPNDDGDCLIEITPMATPAQ